MHNFEEPAGNHFTNTEHNIIMEYCELIPSSVKLTHIFVGQHPSGQYCACYVSCDIYLGLWIGYLDAMWSIDRVINELVPSKEIQNA